MTTMICLVSKQPMPNLRPTLCKSLNFGVKQVILIVSQEMRQSAERLTDIFTNSQLSCQNVTINDVYDYEDLSRKFSEILDDIEGKCFINLTGGTKMMSLALWQVASQKEDTALFYVREDNHQGIWLKGAKGAFNITTQMTINDIFKAHGYDRTKPSSFHPDKAQRAFACWLLKNYYDKPDVIQLLNKVSSANEKKKNISVYFREIDDGHFNKKEKLPLVQSILDYAEKVNLLKQHQDYLLFPTRNKRKFVCGIWLETAVEEILRNIPKSRLAVDDIATGIQFKGWGETDVLVSRPKGLAVIECKTAAYRQTKEMDVIKQTASQKHYGGLTTLNILVSPKKLTNQQALERARRENIYIIDGEMLGSLEQHLTRLLQ